MNPSLSSYFHRTLNNVSAFVKKNPFYTALLIHLTIITIYVGSTLLNGSGHPVFVDLTEGVNLSDASNRIYYTYADNWGEAVAEKQRIVPFTILWALYKVLPLGDDDFIPFRILAGYWFSIIGFILGLKLMYESEKDKSHKSLKLFLAVLLATAVYIYNPWMTNRIIHNFLYFSTFTVPLSFGLAYKYFFGDSKKPWILLVLNGLLLGTFMTTPHTILLVGIALLGVLIIALIRRKFSKILLFIFTVIPIAIISGLYWILPFLLYRPSPDRVESLTIFQLLARNTSLFEILKLQGYWWNYILPDYTPLKDKIGAAISNIVYLIPAALLVSATIVNPKKKINQILAIISVLALFLSTYTFLSGSMYEFLMFNEHTKFIGWLFREIEKFSYLLAFAYAVGVFVAITSIKNKLATKLICLLLIPVFFFYGFYLSVYVHRNLVKVPIPPDFYEMNRVFDLDKSEYNVAFYPLVQRTNWTNHIDSANYITNLSSSKPALPNAEGDSFIRYFIETMLSNSNIDRVNIGKALNTIGVKYLIIRKDSIGFDSERTMSSLEAQTSLEKVWEGNYLAIYNNIEYKGLLEVRNYKLSTNLGLDVWGTLDFADINSRNYLIEYLDNPFEPNLDKDSQIPTAYLIDSEGPMDIAMNSFINSFVFPADKVNVSDPDSNWAIGSLTNKTHAETDLYFQNYDIRNRQLNYDHEVILTLGGFKWPKLNGQVYKSLEFSFIPSQGYKVEPKDNKLNISYDGEEKDDVWSIFPSSRFKVGNISSIGLKGKIDAPEYLEPHFKFRYYDSFDKYLGVQVFYPKDGTIESVFKIPAGTDSIEFSIWTRGKDYGHTSFRVEELGFYDLGQDYTYPEVNTEVKTSCRANCVLMARLLKSNNYPSLLEFDINGSKYVVNNTSLNSKYMWIKVADIENPSETANVKIRNIEGFNSIAVLAIIDSSLLEQKLAEINAFLDSNTKLTIYEGGATVYLDDNYEMNLSSGRNALANYVRYSPVKYSFEITKLPEAAYLMFKRPYKPAWMLTCSGSQAKPALNSFSNAWAVKNLGNCTIVYFPQDLYMKGLMISGIAISGLILGILVHFLPIKYPRFSVSNWRK